MSELYKEALREAKQLRELAEQDAKNSIVEAIAPFIKNIIAKESGSSKAFLFEEEGELSTMSDPELAGEDVPEDIMPDSSAPAPIEVGGSDIVNSALPDEDGKITIDFDQLWVEPGQGAAPPPVDTDALAPGEELSATAPAEEPMVTEPQEALPASPDMVNPETLPPPAPTVPGEEEEEQALAPPPMAESVKSFKNNLAEVAMKIDTAYYRGRLSDITKESIKTQLFGLLESLEYLTEAGILSGKQAKLNEHRLEFLFLKLKEAGLQNSYTKENHINKDDTMNRSLKEFAAKLFESDDQESLEHDSQSSGDTGVPVHKDATANAEHQSGVSPEVSDLLAGSDKDGVGKAGSVKAAPVKGAGKAAEKPWEDGLDECSAGFGDAAEKPVASPEMFFEIDEAELKEAIRSIRKENVSKKVKAKEGVWASGVKPEGGDDGSKKALKKESKKPVKEQFEAADMFEGDDESGMEEDLVLSMDLGDELEDELEVDDLDVEVDVVEDEDDLSGVGEEDDLDSGLEGGLEGDLEGGEEDMEGMEEPVGGLDLGDEGEGGEGEEMLLHDEEEEGMDEMSAFQMENRKLRKSMFEARKMLQKTRKLTEARALEVKRLKEEMVETNVFLSKLLYLNKFLQMEGLSKKQKQQILEHLDRASTVAEAKTIYTKISEKLNEARSGSRVVGSASKSTTAGSAKLNESVRSSDAGGQDNDPIVGSFERWQQLAGMAKKQ